MTSAIKLIYIITQLTKQLRWHMTGKKAEGADKVMLALR